MIGLRDEVLVTSAISNNDVEKALILCYSLKQAYTTRKLAVVASSNISLDLRRSLNHAFDFLFIIDEDRNKCKLKLEDFAKLYSILVLKSFEKCAYLSPNMLALKNCDDIFSQETKGLVMVEGDKNASVFLCKPSIDLFLSLSTGLRNFDINESRKIGTYLDNWTTNQYKNNVSLSAKYNHYIKPGKPLVSFANDISMVNLTNSSNESQIEALRNSGLLGKLVSIHWMKIRNENVLPLVTQSYGDGTDIPKHIPNYTKEPIAIIGMSCRYPGANNMEEFWDLLFQGQDGTCKPPLFRWMRQQCSRYKGDIKNTNAGFLKVPVDEFDAQFFGISPKEALFMDPQHRLLHELIWEGLEDACIDPHSLCGTTGSVFIGPWLNDYKDILAHSGTAEFYRAYMGNSIGAAAARLSFLLGLTGPSVATESGCSSAMVGVHLACRSLQMGETNLALAAGVNLLLHPFDKEFMPMVLSPDGHCKTFSEDANGFCRAEGCGVVVLKRLSDAVKDGDNIWAVIRGSGVAQEGVSNSMGTPTVHGESLAMKNALKDARVEPEEVTYVETHGTGTTVGDPMEVAAIAKAYHTPARKTPLLIGSVKTNVGHTESCSGLTGLMKVVLGMFHEAIPAHINFTKLNPSVDLEAIPAVIPLERVEWKRVHGKPRLAGVSSFGITGTDTHVIVEEPPTSENVLTVHDSSDRPFHILKLSAKTEEALEILLNKWRDNLRESKESFADVAYSSNSGRANFSHRVAIIAKTKEDAVSCIEQQKYMKAETSPNSIDKICFLFSGQGSQYPRMAKCLYDFSPVFQMHFDYCEKIMNNCYNISLKKVLWPEKDCPEEDISRTIYSQTSIFCVEYALLKLWESWGVKPHYALGHSLGEFAAAVCAGIISVENAIKLVAERSVLIDELPHGKMLVIQADYNEVQKKMKMFTCNDTSKILDYAAFNSSEQTVVAGDSEIILEFSKFCADNKLKCVILAATHAFHSRHMDPMLEKYKYTAASTKSLQEQACGYISGMRGDLVSGNEVDAAYWVQHTREKVNFLKASQKAIELGCNIFIEIGPQPVLSALTMMNSSTNLVCLPSLKRKADEWETILDSVCKLYLKGIEIDWEGLDMFYNRKKVRLPHYPFIGKKFWPDLMQTSGKSIHPLIGSPIPNASSIKIFQNGINLSTHAYIKDHVFGKNVVFPAAGYLEMCLAAGLAAVEGSVDSLGKPTRAIRVENLFIKAPFALYESKTSQVQTVVEPCISKENENDWNDVIVKIFQRKEADNSRIWLEHAMGTFSPLPTAEEQIINFDIGLFNETLLKPPNDEEIPLFYEKFSYAGAKFGPLFQSLEKVWINGKPKTILCKVKLPESDGGDHTTHHILHPVILDAMIQALLILKLLGRFKQKLHVPIKIGKFLWLSAPSGAELSDLYVYAYDEQVSEGFGSLTEADTCKMLLIDSNGKVLAFMTNLEFISTSLKAIESVLENQTSVMPHMWEDTWRPKMGPSQYRHDLTACKMGRNINKKWQDNLKQQFNELAQVKQETFRNLENIVYFNFLRCFYEGGWKPTLNAKFTEESMRKDMGIQKEFHKLFSYILQVFEEERILENVGPETWKIVRVIPTSNEIQEKLASQVLMTESIQTFSSTFLLSETGNYYLAILKGEKYPNTILFHEDNEKKPSIEKFYEDYRNYFAITKMISDVLQWDIEHCKSHTTGHRNIFRVLEVGAGTGTFTQEYMQLLSKNEMEVEYTFTDITQSTFPAAEQRLQSYLGNVTFKTLNIEEDPIDQGFTPNYYDCIISNDVIHETRNLLKSLNNVRMLLKQNGKFILLEQTRKNRILTYLYGLQGCYWHFDDFEIRPNHCTLSAEKWKETLILAGFDVLESFPSTNNYHSLVLAFKTENNMVSPLRNELNYFILFHQDDNPTSKYLLEQIQRIERNLIVVRRGGKFQKIETERGPNFTLKPDSDHDFIQLLDALESCYNTNIEAIIYAWSLDQYCTSQDSILQPYFYLTKNFLSRKQSTPRKIISLVNGIMPVEDNDLSHFHFSTIWGFTKTLRNERSDVLCRCIDIGGNEDAKGVEQTFYELWSTDKGTQVAYHDNTRYTCKLQSLKPSLPELKLPSGTDRFKLALPETKSLLDLQFIPLEPFVLEAGEVEIQVKACSLNFKDVFNVLKPTDDFKYTNGVGIDFAGVVKRLGSQVSLLAVGDYVCGLNSSIDELRDPLPSHIKIHEQDLGIIPEGMTFGEASTLPLVLATSAHCLIDIAQIKSEDTVLIHTASGGVGLCALDICKHVGVTIIATAGSRRKQNYLKSLGIDFVLYSRNTNYAEEILKITNGRGVDVVLNSLTSEGFKEATLRACAKNARFVEMSKLMIWTPEEVKKIRPDVQYTIVDLSTLPIPELRVIKNKATRLVDTNVVRPVPYVRFDAVHIQKALEYLSKAKHIGKVVCVMPEVRLGKDGNVEVYTPIFNRNATYLITGGLGGIGFVICRWMVEKGAKHLVLAGRKAPSDEMMKNIKMMEKENEAQIIPVQVDIGNFEECKQLIQSKIHDLGLPSLKGIMHAAGTLQDGLIENQNWEKLSSTFKTKVGGTLNLHELTKHINLEHFVLFSSMAAIFGSPGQCNHAAGNSFEDTFAHYRHSIGLPATTVNWGQWGEVGIATDVDFPGLKAISNLQGIAGLEYAMKSQRTQTAVFNVESFVPMTKLFPQVSHILDERVWKAKGNLSSTAGINFSSDDFWQEYDNLEGTDEKKELIRGKLKLMLRKILKLDDSDVIDDNANFQELGVDSLMFVEMKNAIQSLFGERVTVNASALKECNTVNLLSKALVKIIEGEELEEEKISTAEEIAYLIKEDICLPENIIAKSNQIKIGVKDVSKILLTGCSGTLGPYILKELSKMPQITKIICLMRPSKLTSEEERLQKILKDRDLLSEIDMTKVQCVSGNIAMPKIGMETELWEELCNSVDAVFHCAAKAQHTEHYKKRNSNNDIRAVNVGGTKNILEFACTGNKLKQVYFASSMLAVATLDKDGGYLSEDWPEENDYDGVTTLAYPITKFVGDMLMKQAILERGVPGKSFRFPYIVGDSKTGRFVLEQNHAMHRYFFILQHGMMPSNPIPMAVLPVDICAWASVKIFFDENAPDDVFNVSKVIPDSEQDLVYVAEELGYKVDIVKFSEFTEKLRATATDDSPYAIFRDFYKNDEELLSLYNTTPALKQWILDGDENQNFLMSKKIAKIMPEFYNNRCSSMDCLYRDLLFAKNQGWFAKFNL